MRRLSALLGIFLVFSPALALAQQYCDAAIIQALKTSVTLNSGETVAETLHDASCKASRHSGSAEVFYDDFAGMGASEDTAQACASNDMNYFKTQSSQLAISVLPEDVIKDLPQICTGDPVRLTARQDAGGDIVVISASYHPSGSALVAVVNQGLEIKPEGALICNNNEIKKAGLSSDGGKLVPVGHSVTCTRTIKSSISISIGTTEGDRQIFLPEQHRIEMIPTHWDHSVDKSKDHIYQCMDLTRHDFPLRVGGSYLCDDYTGACDRQERDSGICASLHPEQNCYLSVDGTPTGSRRPCD